MTTRDLLYLSWMAYLDMPPLYVSILRRGGAVPVAAFADSVLRMDAAGVLKCVKLNADAANVARALMKTGWIVRDYINRNENDGFVAYVVEASGMNVIAMRGSESPGECIDNYVDWVDNVCEPFSGSVQLAEIQKLSGRYAEGETIFTGHSKGGHNALAALAVSANPAARAVVFNAQGFGEDSLTAEQQARLATRAVNYVVADDIVGALLKHPERRVYVQRRKGMNPHMPEAFLFDEYGEAVKARRSLKSYAAETVSRLSENSIQGAGREGVARLCRAALSDYAR